MGARYTAGMTSAWWSIPGPIRMVLAVCSPSGRAKGTSTATVISVTYNWVTSVAFSPDCKQIASSSFDCSVLLWNVDSGACVDISKIILSDMQCVIHQRREQNQDGTLVASASFDGTVRIWNAQTGDEIGPHWKVTLVISVAFHSALMSDGWYPALGTRR